MSQFKITARTASICLTFTAIARSSGEAALLTAAFLGDQPCGITVIAGAQ